MRTMCTYLYCTCITVLCLLCAINVSAQKKDYSLTFTKESYTLSELFREIERQTGLSPSLNSKQVNQSQTVTISPSKTSLSQVLAKVAALGYETIITKHSLVIHKTKNDSSNAFKSQVGIDTYPSKTEHKSINYDTTQDRLSITGSIINNTGAPLPGASVFITGTNHGTAADERGRFTLTDVPPGATISVTIIGYEKQTKAVAGQQYFTFTMTPTSSSLDQVEVSTGYQKIPKERATGSFDFIDNKLINRSVSTDFISRLNGIASGVYFNTNPIGNDPKVSIRGRSTIFANTDPLIVIDNFPYDGDINSINPNDIESISILKDAAAASIWGIRAGNGVIVITTKKGKNKQAPKISFNSNITISPRPDLNSTPQLTSSQFIEVEEYLFSKKYYDIALNYLKYNLQSPVIDLLQQVKTGTIPPTDTATILNDLRNTDVRTQMSKYLYRPTVSQQYNLNIRGGGDYNQYYFSVGYDKVLSSNIPNTQNRLTLNGKNTWQLVNNKLTLGTDIFFSKTNSTSNILSFNPQYPYTKLTSANGKHLPVYQTYRNQYKDTVGGGYLLDWNYIPLDEVNNKDAVANLTEYKLALTINYKITKDINIDLLYQYSKGTTEATKDADQNSYYARNLINTYSIVDYSTGIVTRPIPLGNIVSSATDAFDAQYGRTQLNLDKKIGNGFLSAIAGFEIRSYNSESNSSTIYGYDPTTASSISVNYANLYSSIINGQQDYIQGAPQKSFTTDNSLSYYLNGSYSYDSKYTITASARRDESNLFGVRANQKGVPLWSIGASWNISEETFFKNKSPNFPNIKLRATNGYNGNVIKTISSYTTTSLSSPDEPNAFFKPFQTIVNPPNPSLSWEKVHIINLGLDISTKSNRVSGSIDLYKKHGQDLIGNSQIAPQTGVVQFTGNTSAVLTKGIDLILNTTNINRKLIWNTTLLLNFVTNRITKNTSKLATNSAYLTGNYINPMEGKPYSAIFSYPSPGLDSSGNPRGYLAGHISEDYSAIRNSTDVNDLKYNGPATPTRYGTLINTFTYKSITLSFSLSYKGGYYFRRGSYVLNPTNYKQADYEKRWQKPGDEQKTIVPAIAYPLNGNRDAFYLGTEQLVEKGDYLKIKDIQISYSPFANNSHQKVIKTLQLYGYINNINGIIWTANHISLDPDFVLNGYYIQKTPVSFSFGIRCDM